MTLRTRRLLEGALLLAILGVATVLVLHLVAYRAPVARQVSPVPNLRDQEAVIPGRPHFGPDYIRSPASIRRTVSFRYSTNSLGLRTGEISEPTRPGFFRVVVVGECVAFGNGVSDGEPWPAVLEGLIRKTHPDHFYEVINGSLPVQSSEAGARLQTTFLPMRPDLVIFAPGADTVFLPAHQGVAGPVRIRLTDAEYADQMRSYRRVLEDAWQATSRVGVPMVLVTATMNSFFLPDGDKWRDEMVAFARGRNIPLLDTTALLRDIEARDGLVLQTEGDRQRLVSSRDGQPTVLVEVPFRDDNTRHVSERIYDWLDDHPDVSLLLSIDENHPNARGHALIAQAMLDLLESKGLLSRRATTAPPPSGPQPPPGDPARSGGSP